MKQDPQPDLCCRGACTGLYRGRGASLRSLQDASSMTAHQHWLFSITTTHLLTAVQRLPTATEPPTLCPLPWAASHSTQRAQQRHSSRRSTAEAQQKHSSAQNIAEQSQQSSWDSQASPGAGRVPSLQDSRHDLQTEIMLGLVAARTPRPELSPKARVEKHHHQNSTICHC